MSKTGMFFALLFLCLSLHAAQPIPAEEFGKLPYATNPVMSPNGEYFALTVVVEGEPLVVVKSMKDQSKIVGGIRVGDYYVHRYDWANNDRLLVWLRDSFKANGRLYNFARIVAVDKDGKNMMALPMKPNDYGVFRQNPYVLNWLPSDREHVLAVLDNDPKKQIAPLVHKVNIYTGKKKLVQANRHYFYGWLADHEGNVRIGVKYSETRKSTDVTSYLKNEEGKWEVLQKLDYFDHERLLPARFDLQDKNILLVSSTALAEDGEHKEDGMPLFRYDLSKKEVIGPYEDKTVASIMKQIKGMLPDLKLELHDRSRDRRHLVFVAYSDIQPAQYIHLDMDNPDLKIIARQFPHLEGGNHSRMTSISYHAPDGLEIPAFLTLPLNHDLEGDAVPLVVFPHGGPWAHDEWGFDNYVQFFASRGYAVLQPQFRGSTGYGIAHEEAGYGEWGGAIQDDITAGVHHVLKNYNLDRSKVCIVGASFGGYAAAMGLVATPELYKCGVSINGVMNLPSLVNSTRYMTHGNIARTIWNDRKTADKFSPYHQSKFIQAPLLLIASKKDSIVPHKHSRDMYSRVKKKKNGSKYIELKEGEHWRTYEPNEVAIFKAMDEFLAKHL